MANCRYTRAADRARCHRQDNPLPRPTDDELLAMYASRTVESISRALGHNHNTVRSWITRAIHATPTTRAAVRSSMLGGCGLNCETHPPTGRAV